MNKNQSIDGTEWDLEINHPDTPTKKQKIDLNLNGNQIVSDDYYTNRNEDVRRTGEGDRIKYNTSAPNSNPQNLLAIQNSIELSEGAPNTKSPK